jgi:hypothetical protein
MLNVCPFIDGILRATILNPKTRLCFYYGFNLIYYQEGAWYSFLLEAELSPGPSAAGRNRSTGKSSDLIWNRTRDLLACSVVPRPTTVSLFQFPIRQHATNRKVAGSIPDDMFFF